VRLTLLLSPLLAILLAPASLNAQHLELERGHAKLRGQTSTFPDDSLYRDLVGTPADDLGAALRLNVRGDWAAVTFTAHYQLLAVNGARVELNRAFPDPFLAQPVLPRDDLRWMNLSDTLHEGDSSEVVQRLDRLHLGWSGEKTVLRVGRQAVSWGNGLFYHPMDFFNPFDPAAIDTEYKAGDDMLYGQYLLDSGSDWQAVAVQRRDSEGEASADARSYAAKYHSFSATREFDLLLAEHYSQTIAGIGGSGNLGDAVVRGDLTLTDTGDGWTPSAVVNGSWSWIAGGHNMSGSIEYFFNGLGLRQSDYGAEGFLAADDLLARIRRGELFSIGRHYLAGSVQVEVHPLLNITPAVFWNLGDGSALAQLSLRWDLADNWQLLGAANVPLGPTGTEFGGLELPVQQAVRNLGTGPSLLLQMAFYF
jgi:hypothetical protein